MVELAFSAFSHFIIADCLFRGEFLFDTCRAEKKTEQIKVAIYILVAARFQIHGIKDERMYYAYAWELAKINEGYIILAEQTKVALAYSVS